jgi:hypothetical protein
MRSTVSARFHNEVDLSTVARVVRHCCRELDIPVGPTTLRAVEDLAAGRLTALALCGY